jgi:SpoVK/Ycf46/Vps4 family AAA+-type ATPase
MREWKMEGRFFTEAERRQMCFYARRCATGALAEQVEPVLANFAEYFTGRKLREPDDDEDGPAWRSTRYIVRTLKKYNEWPDSGDSCEKTVLFAQEEFRLDDEDVEILRLVLRYQRNHKLEQFADHVVACLEAVHRAVAALCGLNPTEAHRRIVPNGNLMSSGILVLNTDNPNGLCGRGGALQLSPPLRNIMYRPYESREAWSAAIFGQPLSPSLAWQDFDHFGELRNVAARLVAGAKEQGAKQQPAKGINILLHGPAGTGKTEFCKALAAEAGTPVWAVGEEDEWGGEPTRGERLASLKLAQNLMAKKPGSVILLDEAEDVLREVGRFDGSWMRESSKVYVNRFLEGNPVPVLWTCNSLSEMSDTVLRRMSLIIECCIPNVNVRSRILSRAVEARGLGFDENTVRRFAARYEASPSLFATAANVASLSKGGEADFEKVLDCMVNALGQATDLHAAEVQSFDPALVRCSDNLTGIIDTLTRKGAPLNWSMCIDGPPGSGKSLYARHLASRIGIEVIQKRASDLLGMYVGQSEKAIARAFADARARRAMLIFDEADSFLSDRRDALRSWEITQVNEMLTWMEQHPYPFVCTTNLKARLDEASFRRFTLKLRFEPLDPAQSVEAFRRFFGVEPPDALPEGLTPGDFDCVKRKAALYAAVTPERLLRWLVEELAARGQKAGSFGFLPSKVR